MPPDENLYGLILAGGRSTRMGRDKAALCYHGDQTQVQHLSDLIAPYVQETFLSIREDQKGEAHLQGFPLVPDAFSISSPLNGILSAMHEYPNMSFLVLAVDMPNITSDAIETLIRHRKQDCIGTAFQSPVKGGPDPLFAIWEAHGKVSIKHFIEETGKTCPRGVLKSLGAHIIEEDIAPHVLANINTPEELEDMQQQGNVS